MFLRININIMPFDLIKSGNNKGKYKSPSGRIFTEAQVKLYYSSGGFNPQRLAKIRLGKSMKKLK